MPIPTKYTMHHTLVTDDVYDAYLPRLADALDARGVKNIRLYDAFAQSGKILYWPSDTHWNSLGMAIGVKELKKVAVEE